jgi:hypothetical protein
MKLFETVRRIFRREPEARYSDAFVKDCQINAQNSSYARSIIGRYRSGMIFSGNARQRRAMRRAEAR